MEGPRAPAEQEFAQIVQFLNTNLRPNQNWSIAAEYPLALTHANLHNMRVVIDRDEVLSHAVVRPIVTKTPLGLFKVAAIGSVVTSSQHRNRGLSQTILNDCLQTAERQLCDFAILWTNLFDFYRKLGFELAGQELSICIDRDMDLASAAGLRILEGHQVSAEAIHRLYTQHTVGSLRTPEEIQKYLQIPNSRVFTAWDPENRLVAYAVEGKGADLKGYIHEWGGGVSKLLPLFAHIRKTLQQPLTILIPAHAANLLRSLEEHGFQSHHGFLGMIKLVHPEQVFNKLKRLARGLGISDLVIEQHQDRFRIGRSGSAMGVMSEGELVKLLFGPADVNALATLGLEELLPIPMWVWGWDSI